MAFPSVPDEGLQALHVKDASWIVLFVKLLLCSVIV